MLTLFSVELLFSVVNKGVVWSTWILNSRLVLCRFKTFVGLRSLSGDGWSFLNGSKDPHVRNVNINSGQLLDKPFKILICCRNWEQIKLTKMLKKSYFILRWEWNSCPAVHIQRFLFLFYEASILFSWEWWNCDVQASQLQANYQCILLSAILFVESSCLHANLKKKKTLKCDALKNVISLLRLMWKAVAVNLWNFCLTSGMLWGNFSMGGTFITERLRRRGISAKSKQQKGWFWASFALGAWALAL